jgi:hypothetical protein
VNRVAARRGSALPAVAVPTRQPAPSVQKPAAARESEGRPAVTRLRPRVVPLRVEPVPGEGLDSWLHAYARRLQVTVTTLLNALGLRDLRDPGLDLTIALSASQARRAAHAAGLGEEHLHAMTLASYAPTVLHLGPDRRTLDATATAWLRPRGSRYCPDCLRENGGRWLLAWQLSWVFACTRHQALLRDECPACGMLARTGNPTKGPAPPASGCAAITPPHRPRSAVVICGNDLSSLPALRLRAGDPRLAAQQVLNDYLSIASTIPVNDSEDGDGQGLQGLISTMWSDLHALASWFAATASTTDFTAFDDATAAAWHAINIRPWARQQYLAAADARVTAALLTWALPVVTAAHPASRGDPPPTRQPSLRGAPGVLEELAQRRRRAHRAACRRDDPVQGFKPAGMLTVNWRELSDPLKSLLLRAGDRDLPKLARLRARTSTRAARLPSEPATICARRARWMPQTLWPDWLIRLMPYPGYRNDVHRAALSAALLVPGLPIGVSAREAVARTHPHLPPLAVPGMLRRYLDDGFAIAMTHPTLTEAADAIGIDTSTLIEQLRRLETDLGATLFQRASPAGRPHRPTSRGATLLRILARPDIQTLHATHLSHTPVPDPAISDSVTNLDELKALIDCPRDLRRAVQNRCTGWIQLERFATAMTHPTLTKAADTIGINRTTLIEQLHHLETSVGAPLFHRATADGQPHRPTPRGTALLAALARPDIQTLRASRTRHDPAPDPLLARQDHHQSEQAGDTLPGVTAGKATPDPSPRQSN